MPSELGLSQLDYLDLSYNDELTGRIPTDLGLLSKLTYLGLDLLLGSVPTELIFLAAQGFKLGNAIGDGRLSRRITSAFPASVLWARVLGVGYWQHPDEIFDLSRLTSFRTLSGVTGSIPTALGQLTRLEFLQISRVSRLGPNQQGPTAGEDGDKNSCDKGIPAES